VRQVKLVELRPQGLLIRRGRGLLSRGHSLRTFSMRIKTCTPYQTTKRQSVRRFVSREHLPHAMNAARVLHNSIQAVPADQQGDWRPKLRRSGHGAERGGHQARILMLCQHERACLHPGTGVKTQSRVRAAVRVLHRGRQAGNLVLCQHQHVCLLPATRVEYAVLDTWTVHSTEHCECQADVPKSAYQRLACDHAHTEVR